MRIAAMVLCCCLLPLVEAPAASLETRDLICPITGRSFKATLIPVRRGGRWDFGAPGPADMGVDEDGCRVNSGVSEYDYYVVTSPWCYFSALSIEWDSKGRFRGRLSAEFKEWVRGPELNGEWVTDRNESYKRAQRRLQPQGVVTPKAEDWEIPQLEIPIEKKYRFAIACYQKRGHTHGFLAKLALNAAWAIRVRLSRPISHQALAGGVEELNHHVNRAIEEGEEYDRDKMARVHGRIFREERLSDEAYFMAGDAYNALLLRQGRLEEARQVLLRMLRRFDGKEGVQVVLRGLVRQRIKMVDQAYVPFLRTSGNDFVRAVANEEFPRTRLPEVVLALAEIYRRIEDNRGAMDWYLCLARMSETQPEVRKDLRQRGGAPQVDAPYLVHLGWRADKMIARLEEEGVENNGEPQGETASLVRAILEQGLGTPEYENPNWRPMSGRGSRSVELYLGEVGKAVIDYEHRMHLWPDSLGDMWLDGFVRDRNALNRFHCPHTGAKFRYLPPEEDVRATTVLVATAEPIETEHGARYAAYLANNKTVWSDEALLPGELYEP